MLFLRNALVYLQVGFFITLFTSCEIGKKEKYLDSDEYAFSAPKVVTLSDDLNEISGITYYEQDTSVFAIIDEDALLYKIPLKNPKSMQRWTFDKKRDYEDLVLVDSIFYVLVSNGDVISVRFNNDSINSKKHDFSNQSKDVNEFESIYVDRDSARMFLLCKSCTGDPKSHLSSFVYKYKEGKDTLHRDKNINLSILESKYNIDKHLKPSAAAIHPITKDLYVISAIQSLMVVFKSNGDFKELIKLNPGIYKQPEGMAFTPQGDLIISNEFADDGFANLLLLKNKLKGK